MEKREFVSNIAEVEVIARRIESYQKKGIIDKYNCNNKCHGSLTPEAKPYINNDSKLYKLFLKCNTCNYVEDKFSSFLLFDDK